MGDIYLQQKEYENALKALEKANAQNIIVKYLRALALDGSGKTDEAKALFKEVATWNFNSIMYAIVRNKAIAKS